MTYKLILFAKQRFKLVPCLFTISESIKVKHKICGDMDAHEVEGFIYPVQKLGFLNILLGLNFSSHFHPIQSLVAQVHLHIFPPINVIEGCKDLGR